MLMEGGGQQQSHGGFAPRLLNGALGRTRLPPAALEERPGPSGVSARDGAGVATSHPGGAFQRVRAIFVGGISAQMHEATAWMSSLRRE